MATRVAPTPTDADNPAGSSTLAACTDWRSGVRRFHVGTGHHEPTYDAGYTTAGLPSRPPLSISLLLPRGSPYTRLGCIGEHTLRDEPSDDTRERQTNGKHYPPQPQPHGPPIG